MEPTRSPKLTPKQLATLQRFTRTVWQFMDYANFTIYELGCGEFMVSASNLDAPWWAKHESACAIIGKRGGLHIREANQYIRKWA